MSKKATRSTKPKADPDAKPQQQIASAVKKVFYISEKLLHVDAGANNGGERMILERFYHPGKARTAMFITLEERSLMEVLEYAEPRRSWLLNEEVCSNGRLYMTTPVDPTLLALHHLRKHCTQRAMCLDSISMDEPEAESTQRLLTKFVSSSSLQCIADKKNSGELSYYKYNPERALAWLALKTRQVMTVLKAKQVHCGLGAKSQNYVRSEKLQDENDVNEMDYLRMSCDYVGRYLDADLHEDLTSYLNIPSEIQALVEEQATAQKRKSQQVLAGAANNKKIKLNNGEQQGKDAASKLRNSSLVDSDDLKEETITPPSTPAVLKERSLTAKEKALAKGAKGSKSIASFFKAK